MDDKKIGKILISILGLGVNIGLIMAIVASGLSLGIKIALICLCLLFLLQHNRDEKSKLSVTIGDEKQFKFLVL